MTGALNPAISPAMPVHGSFPPTRAEALRRIAAVQPAAYARSRNALDGAVSRLSPYISHGLVSLPEVLAGVAAQHALAPTHKFVFELGWRAYFQHVWQHRGEAILHSLHPGLLPEGAYATEIPADVREARTGVPVIDQAVRTLYATGWLHNHARMWLASYLVHLRKVHWRSGADWMFAHLLDGDLASNHLSWQWVAGTGSHKPYLFNADNVARYAPSAWHSPGSVIDQSYEALGRIANTPHWVLTEPPGRTPEGLTQPSLRAAPVNHLATTPPCAADVAGRDIWLLHPWALGDPPADLPDDTLVLGLLVADFHQAWPWSDLRWAFVGERMKALSTRCWWGAAPAVADALRAARSVQTVANPHIDGWLPATVLRRAPRQLFAPINTCCHSFSQWWTRVMRGVQHCQDLPGWPVAPIQLAFDYTNENSP